MSIHNLCHTVTDAFDSDLPEDHSTVLLLGVTRISSSPSPARRPCSLPLTSPSPNLSDNSARSRRRSFSSRRTIIRRNSSRKVRREQDPPGDDDGRGHVNETSSGDVTPSNRNSNDHPPPSSPCPVMDKSVDSIGTCSLDVEASADISDHSEDAASIGTLRSVALPTPSPEPHLPSYLSLACTVNGYSTTTNYDPERLSKSRDASPHRPYDYDHHQNHLTPVNTYCIQNNLLSPPNLVPPPPTKTTANMSNNALTHQQIYNSSTTMKFATRESRSSFTKNGYSVDKVDACIENTVFNSESRFNKYQRSTVTVNGQNDRHSKSMNDKLLDEDLQDIGMKQSSSSPTLPVLRHLRPEFRAQLPVISPRKLGETVIQKSITVPKITENVNGHSKETVVVKDAERNGSASCEASSNNLISKDKALVKDGHYFLEICAKEINRLLQLADQAERESLLEELSEDVKGKLRAAYGKARLLVSQKIEQFKGLCANNINQSTDEQFPTTSEDLQGFWDMVMLQVDEVNTLFNDIERLRKNNWQVEVVDAPDTNKTNGVIRKQKKTNIARPSTAGSEELRKHRDAQRKAMMEERRKAMKSLKPSESIEIFVPESS